VSKWKITLSGVGPVLALCVLAGCEHTVSQDKTVRTRSDGTRVTQEDKVTKQSDGTTVRTESRKVDRPND